MALSGQVVLPVTGQDDLIFDWRADQDIAARSSRVYWTLILLAKEYGQIIATPGSGWSVTVDGQTQSGKTDIAIGNNEEKVLAEGSFLLEHLPDGTKSFDFSFYQEFRITFGGEYISTVTGTGTGELDPIVPVAAPVPQQVSVALGSVLEIRLDNPQGVSCSLSYRLGGSAGTIGTGITDKILWTVPRELASQFPQSPSAVLTLISTGPYGDRAEATVTVYPPADMAPVLTEAAWQDTSPAMGLFGQPAANISKLTLTFDAAFSYGARLVSCRAYLGDSLYAGGVLRQAGTQQLRLVVTDSREMTGEMAWEIQVLPWFKPRLTITAHRCDAEGNADDAGAFAVATVRGAVAEIEGNVGALSFLGQEAQEVTGEFKKTYTLEAPTEDALPLSATLSDKLSAVSEEMILSPGYATMDFLGGGRGIAFGTTATEPGFTCAMDARFTGKVFFGDTELGDLGKILDEINGEVV